MLIHQLSGGYWGKYEEMEEDLDNSRKFMEKIYEIYEEHTKLKRSELKKILKKDEWWDYQTCLKYGLVDGVYNGWGGVSGGGGATASVISPSGGVITRSSSKK
jgi:ATP-dependent protease ClpP protease subunit